MARPLKRVFVRCRQSRWTSAVTKFVAFTTIVAALRELWWVEKRSIEGTASASDGDAVKCEGPPSGQTSPNASCYLRCGSDAAVWLPSVDGGWDRCSCDQRACDAALSPCCATYKEHCGRKSDGGGDTHPRDRPAPVGFPPRHSGPEKHYVDAVTLFCLSAGNFLRQMGPRELVEWLEYMRYAGVGNFTVYDCGEPGFELQDNPDVVPYIAEGYVTVIPWYREHPEYNNCWDSPEARWAIYADAHARGGSAVWRSVLDPDEYPYVSGDTEPGFLTRLLSKVQLHADLTILQTTVAGGRHDGTTSAEDYRALRYSWHSNEPIPGQERYFMRVAAATGYGKHRAMASTSQSGDAQPAQTVARIIRSAGPELRSTWCFHSDPSRCPTMVEQHDLKPAFTAIATLAENGLLFPGIPSRPLRIRMVQTWPFSEVFSLGEEAARERARAVWAELQIALKMLEPEQGSSAKRAEGIDELHANHWPPDDASIIL